MGNHLPAQDLAVSAVPVAPKAIPQRLSDTEPSWKIFHRKDDRFLQPKVPLEKGNRLVMLKSQTFFLFCNFFSMDFGRGEQFEM